MKKILFLSFALFFSSCSDEYSQVENDQFLIGAGRDHLEQSSIEGNLVTTAIKEVHDLDIVFYPSALILNSHFATLSSRYSGEQLDPLLSSFPSGPRDQFMVGTMSGRDIKRFILSRAKLDFRTDLQVAGVRYHIHFVGGWPQYQYIRTERGQELDDRRRYRVAVSDYFYFSGGTFPGYKYGNWMSLRDFSEGFISARESLRTYLESNRQWPFLRDRRALVTRGVVGDAGRLSIQEIRGSGHISPHRGKRVVTQGVVTARGSVENYPGGEEAYIQSWIADASKNISSAIHLHYKDPTYDVQVGDLIEVEGVVYEQQFSNGTSRATIREIQDIRVLSRNHPLPEPIKLGAGGVPFPEKVISNWNGNINLKPDLNLQEGIDFFKRFEGMRVTIENPRVVGFRGGNENDFDDRPKNYLNLYVVADGDRPHPRKSLGGGIIIDQKRNIFNPQILTIISDHFTAEFYPEAYYNVGDLIKGELSGILTYTSNIFGDGQRGIILPEPQEPLRKFAQESTTQTPLSMRPKTSLVATDNQLTVGTYNVENLAASQTDRFKSIGESIAINMQCPDIIAFTEIQDGSHVSFRNTSSAESTMQKIIDETFCERDVQYRSVHVPPFFHSDGGQPGGNIQVAFLYDANRVEFYPRGNPDSVMDMYLTPEGSLEVNPTRLYTESDVFRSTRKSLVAEFLFKGERVFIVGNHLNSKFGDSPMWGADQPMVPLSDNRRQRMAKRINEFIRNLNRQSPEGHIIVIGDFNAFTFDNSMKVLAGDILTNLSTHKDLLHPNDKYTFNFNGNSQAIDHIFVGPSLLNHQPEIEIPHINTDFMGRIADHDPVVARFKF